MGLLVPIRVDSSSGYRYYSPEQARDALTIALLREMDLPLAVIARALAAGPDRRAQILRAERDRLAERISRDQARLKMLERLAEGGLPGYEVTLRREPERRLAVVRAVCAPAEIGEKVGECAGRLRPCSAGRESHGSRRCGGCTHWTWKNGWRSPSERRHRREGTPGLEFEVLPGGLVAETVHIGPYAQLPLAYNALFAAVHERGLRPQAPVREAYLVGPTEAPQEELMTRLIIPVQESMA
ncbi:GyrI-like domain-containing protein [Streptosporangium lutulentum]